MIYIKSTLAGIGALGVAALSGIVFLVIKYRPTPNGTPGWDPISLLKSQLVWVVFLLVFVAGFYWEYRKGYHWYIAQAAVLIFVA
jgi:hypothetical protein